MWKKLRDDAIRNGMKLMANPNVMKLVSNPKVMSAMMRALQLRGEVQQAVDARVQKLAKRFKLATKEELRDLQSTMRTLEKSLKQVQSKVDGGPAGRR